MQAGCRMRHFFYLHGLASSPRSGKARYLVEQFSARGFDLHFKLLADAARYGVWTETAVFLGLDGGDGGS